MRVKKRSLYNVDVDYNGEKLASDGKIKKKYSYSTIKVSEVPSRIMHIYKYEKTEKEFILKRGFLIFDIEGDEAVFIEDFASEHTKTLIYNVEEKKANMSAKEFIVDKTIDERSLSEIEMFVLDVLYEKNTYVYDNIFYYISKELDETILNNLLKIALDITEGIEKVLKTCPDIIEKNISRKELAINNDGEISKVTGIPSFAIRLLKKSIYASSYLEIKEMTEKYGSDAVKLVLEYIECYAQIFEKNKTGCMYGLSYWDVHSFLKDIIWLLDNEPKYRLKQLLDYLTRQNFYYSTFNLPYKESNLLKDLIDLSRSYKLTYDRYPSHLEYTHDIMAKNISLLNQEEKEELFKEAVSKYKDFEYKGKKYSIISPQSISNLVQEGNVLNHCVGGYVDKIIRGESKIFFLRLNSAVDRPFITIELNGNNELMQARGCHNSEPELEASIFIQHWINFVNKKERIAC